MSFHQCENFKDEMLLIHERSVWKIGNYLLEISVRGIIYDPNKKIVIELSGDLDFGGGRDRDNM